MTGGAVVTGAMVACKKSPPGRLALAIVGDGDTGSLSPAGQEAGIETLPEETREEALVKINSWMAEGHELRTPEDEQVIIGTRAGVDFSYNHMNNSGVAAIRGTENPIRRLCMVLGWIGVEEEDHKRYSDSYNCNGYLIDALTFLLGNEEIGSRYEAATGRPWVAGITSEFWKDEASLKKANEDYPYLHSNNLDWWMKTYGGEHGWKRVTTKKGLEEKLKSGYVGVGITPNEEVLERMGDAETFYGHAFVVFSLGEEAGLGVSQSTVNRMCQTDPPEEKITPESGVYNFYVHRPQPADMNFVALN